MAGAAKMLHVQCPRITHLEPLLNYRYEKLGEPEEIHNEGIVSRAGEVGLLGLASTRT